MSYKRYQESLAPLEVFDPAAFSGDHQYPQELCDFVLGLALIYNDFKDIYIVQALLDRGEPEESFAETPAWGQYTAFRAHAIRLHAGLVHELLEFIQDNEAARENVLFRKLLRQISKQAREAWTLLETVALQKRAVNPLAKALLLMRNKVAFHYDAKELARGYAESFLSQSGRAPFISRGNSLGATRFYFADAAAQSYTFLRSPDDEAKEFLAGTSAVFRQVHVALYEIVTKFIQARGFAWRKPPS